MSNLLMSFNPLHKHPLLYKATLGTPFYTATYLVTSLPHLCFHVPFVPQHLSSLTYLVKAMVSPVVMHGCESWTVKKAECQRIDAFELWC